MKSSFHFLSYHQDLLIALSPTAEDFCQIWKNFLVSNGWTECEFEKALIDDNANPLQT